MATGAYGGPMLVDMVCEQANAVGVSHATVLIGQSAWVGYQPYCAVIESGGTLVIVNPDPIPHNPADNVGPNVRDSGTCFEYAAEHSAAMLTTGGRYVLQFRITDEGVLQASKDLGGTWDDCYSTVRPNGDHVLSYGCTDHWATARGVVVVKAPA